MDATGVPVRRLKLTKASIADRRILANILGASSVKDGWTFPPDELVVQLLQHHFKGRLLISDNCTKWYEAAIEHRHACEEAKESFYTPDDISGLRDYQAQMVSFGLRATKFINADDRGLGKTLDAIALAESVSAKRVLVVCPGYLKLNWQREIKQWAKTVGVVTRGDRQLRESAIQTFMQSNTMRYLIVNYEMIRPDTKRGGYPQLLTMDWDIVIFDEAHRLKSRNTQWLEGAKKLRDHALYMPLLTGNPLDKPEDVWQLLNLMDPLKFSSYWAFVEYYCLVADSFFGKEIVGINQHHKAHFQYALQPYMLRRLKKDVAPELPDKIHHYYEVELEGTQKTFYIRIEKQLVMEMADGSLELIDSLIAKHLRLMQAIANPAILGGKDDSIVERTVMELVNDLMESTDKIIIGTWFVDAAKLLSEKISKGYQVYRIYSELKDTQRDAVVEAFKSYKGKAILIGGIKTMSEGLSIDECDHVIFADKGSLLDNEQFMDRIHRMTSTREKHYHHIVVRNTVSQDREEVLQDRQIARDELLSMQAMAKKMISRYSTN